MATVREHKGRYSVASLCAGLGIGRASFYRRQQPRPAAVTERIHPRALSLGEREEVLGVLNSERFWDQAPGEAYATLLDEGKYLCSERTMYRILAEHQQVRERRDQLRHFGYQAPELLASRPNEVWSWDITKLLGPAKWTYFYLYVILDIFSRYVVGWMLAYRESAELGKKLIEQTLERQNICPGTLTVHADRGPAMKSKVVAWLLAELSVTKTHSRPYVSNDNPYSESHFKTMKYRPEFPERFGSIEDARAHCQAFFKWYNQEHRHSGIGFSYSKRAGGYLRVLKTLSRWVPYLGLALAVAVWPIWLLVLRPGISPAWQAGPAASAGPDPRAADERAHVRPTRP